TAQLAQLGLTPDFQQIAGRPAPVVYAVPDSGTTVHVGSSVPVCAIWAVPPPRAPNRALLSVAGGVAAVVAPADYLRGARVQVRAAPDAVPGGPRLLIEPTAGGGAALASDAASLADYLGALGRDERIGVCLDTCHIHACGHDLSTAASFAVALRAYGRAAG